MNRPPMEQHFLVDTLLGPGLHLLAGSPKVGKSWLALWLSVSIAKGESIWGMDVKQGDTLYLCLEDNEARIQNRLFCITDYAPPTCHFCTQACKLGQGLEQQVELFMSEHPDTVLIIIDTIQMVRTTIRDNTYASDYKDLTALKELADRYGITVLLIHHLRKEEASDVFNRISGTTGMQGAVDSSFTLVEEQRGSARAKLSCVGRDIEYRELELQRNADNVWELVGDSLGAPTAQRDRIVPLVAAIMEEHRELKATPTELTDMLNARLLPGDDVFSNRIVSRRLLECHREISSLGIGFRNYSSNAKRLIHLWHTSDDGDDNRRTGAGPPNTVSIVSADENDSVVPAPPAPEPLQTLGIYS